MLLRHRPPALDPSAPEPRPGLRHLDSGSVSVLRWLNANRVDFVLVGPVARAIRGELLAAGPVAVVPAPYARNYERLARALVAERAGLRAETGPGDGAGGGSPVPVSLTAAKLARGRRWMLSLGGCALDLERAGSHGSGGSAPVVEPRAAGDGPAAARTPRYQELLYEASRFEIADGVAVEVASPEDLEHYSHLRRTGLAPEFRVTRTVAGEPAPPEDEAAPVADASPGAGGPLEA